MSIDFDAKRWDRLKDAARLWWDGRLERPLIQVALTGRDPGRGEPAAPNHGFVPFHDPSAPAEAIVDRWDYNLSCRTFPGDAFPGVWPNFGAGVVAAFLGARLEARRDGDTVWFHPRRRQEIADIRFEYDGENVWLRRVKEVALAAAQRWNGLVQVAMADLGGNLDVLSTFRPGERLLLDLYDHPDHVKRLAWRAHELWHRYFDEINAVLRPSNPGYSAWAGIFCEQPHYMLQCDFCYMISPEMFDEFAKPELEATCRRLPCCFYHLDGPGQLAHLDSLLAIKELKGIQWIPGAGAPDQRHWPEVYRKIRKAGKLIQLHVDGDKMEVLDVVAGQVGSAKGIVMSGEVDASKEARLQKILRRYGAE